MTNNQPFHYRLAAHYRVHGPDGEARFSASYELITQNVDGKPLDDLISMLPEELAQQERTKMEQRRIDAAYRAMGAVLLMQAIEDFDIASIIKNFESSEKKVN